MPKPQVAVTDAFHHNGRLLLLSFEVSLPGFGAVLPECVHAIKGSKHARGVVHCLMELINVAKVGRCGKAQALLFVQFLDCFVKLKAAGVCQCLGHLKVISEDMGGSWKSTFSQGLRM